MWQNEQLFAVAERERRRDIGLLVGGLRDIKEGEASAELNALQ